MKVLETFLVDTLSGVLVEGLTLQGVHQNYPQLTGFTDLRSSFMEIPLTDSSVLSTDF